MDILFVHVSWISQYVVIIDDPHFIVILINVYSVFIYYCSFVNKGLTKCQIAVR